MGAKKRTKLTIAKRRELAIGMIAEAAKLVGWGIMVPREKFVTYLVVGEPKELRRIDPLVARKRKTYTIATATSSGGPVIVKNLDASST